MHITRVSLVFDTIIVLLISIWKHVSVEARFRH